MRFLGMFLIGVAAIPTASFAQSAETKAEQNPLKLSGSIRARYETISGQARAGFNDRDDLYNLRTIISAEYKTGPVRFVAELWDSRVYGSDAGTPVSTNEVNALEPVQAYVATTIEAPFGQGTKFDLRAGRFTLNIGSNRLVTSDDYRNTTNGYTGLRADIAAGDGVNATLIYTLPQVRLPDDRTSLDDNDVEYDRESFDLVLWGGLVAKKNAIGNVTAELSYFHLGERDSPARPTRNRSVNSVGLRFLREPAAHKLDFEIEGIYQFGSARNGLAIASPLRDLSARFLHAEAGYMFDVDSKSRLSLEFDYASGDKGAGSNNRFDPIFGSRRGEYGAAGLYNAILRTNIISPSIFFESTPTKRLDLLASYRPMWLASRTDAFATTGVRDAAGNSGRFAGHQFDFRLRHWLVPKTLRFEFDGLLLAKGRFLETAPNAPRNGNTRYGSFNLTYYF